MMEPTDTLDVPHCEVTRNQCGSDTWTVGQPCQCRMCRAYVLGREEVEAENESVTRVFLGDRWQDGDAHSEAVKAVQRIAELGVKNAELRRQRDEAVNVAKHLLGALMVVRSTYGQRNPDDGALWQRDIEAAEKRLARVEAEQK